MTAPADAFAARDADVARVLPIEARGITVRRAGRAILDRVDVGVSDHGTTVLMGPNGAGKSVLLRVLAALIAPDEGRVTWRGAPARRALRRGLGFVFQKPVLLRRSALANVRYALRATGTGRAQSLSRAHEALAFAGLDHLAGTPARLLSGGEQQRLAIARAVAPGPEVLFLDEPTANLDPASTAHIEALVREVTASGRKVVFVTHDIGQARRLADDIAFMHRGRIVERTPAQIFFEAPASEAARAFVDGRIVL